MPYMEKVVKGLTDIYDEAYDRWVHCQYNQDKLLMLIDNTIPDALALLREREPVEPKGEDCGECGYTLHRINYDGPDKELRHEWFRFCPSCGKAVKWDD